MLKIVFGLVRDDFANTFLVAQMWSISLAGSQEF